MPHTCIINTLVLSRLLGPALHCSTYTSSSYPDASHIFCISKVYCSRMIKFYYITPLLLLLLFLTIFKGVKPESASTPALLLTLSACSQLGAAQSVWFSPPCLSSRDPTLTLLYLFMGVCPPYILRETKVYVGFKENEK